MVKKTIPNDYRQSIQFNQQTPTKPKQQEPGPFDWLKNRKDLYALFLFLRAEHLMQKQRGESPGTGRINDTWINDRLKISDPPATIRELRQLGFQIVTDEPGCYRLTSLELKGVA